MLAFYCCCHRLIVHVQEVKKTITYCFLNGQILAQSLVLPTPALRTVATTQSNYTTPPTRAVTIHI